MWSPLLSHLDTVYDHTFTPLLTRHGIELLTSPSPGASNAELERSYVASVVAWCVELLRGVPVEPAQGLEDAAEEDEEEEEVTASVKGVVKACLLARTGPYVPSPLPRRRAHHPN